MGKCRQGYLILRRYLSEQIRYLQPALVTNFKLVYILACSLEIEHSHRIHKRQISVDYVSSVLYFPELHASKNWTTVAHMNYPVNQEISRQPVLRTTLQIFTKISTEVNIKTDGTLSGYTEVKA